MKIIDANPQALEAEEAAEEAVNTNKGKVDKTNQTPEEKFIRLGEDRVAKALNEIRKLGNLAGPNYKSTKAQRDKIIKLLYDGLHELEDRFEGEKGVMKVKIDLGL